MKHGIHWSYMALVILVLSAPMTGSTAGIFIVSGEVTSADNSPIDGLNVTVSNEDKNQTFTQVTGEGGARQLCCYFHRLFRWEYR